MKLIGAKRRSRKGKKGARTSCADSRLSESERGPLTIQVPASLDGLNVVVVNGVRFTRAGSSQVVIRIAPVKYDDIVFREVDELLRMGYSNSAAYEEIAVKHGFSVEGFGRQYRTRWANRVTRMDKGL